MEAAQAIAVVGAALAALVSVIFAVELRRPIPGQYWTIRPPYVLGTTAACWAGVAVTIGAGSDQGGTAVAALLTISSAVTLTSVALWTRRLDLRLRFTRLRIVIDGLFAGTAVTVCLWLVLAGPALEDATELRRIVSAMLLVIAWTAAILSALLLTVARERRPLILAWTVIGSAVTVTPPAIVWAGPLQTADAVWLAASALAAAAMRTVGLTLLAISRRMRARRARSADQAPVTPDTHEVTSLPSPLELNPSTLASAIVAGLLLPTFLLFPMPVPQLVPLTLVVLLLALFATREYLSTTIRDTLTRELRRQALTDPLTGLVNRRGLTQRLTRIDPEEEWVAATVDVDGFKRVNDLLGYDTADALLVRVGAELVMQVEPPALACRLGGDEFAVIAPGDLATGVTIAENLRQRLAESLRENLHGIAVTTSIGVGVLSEGPTSGNGASTASGRGSGGDANRGAGNDGRPSRTDTDPLSRLADASAALHAAKASSGNTVVAYEGPVAFARDRRQLIEARMRALVRHNRVGLAGLPVIDLTSGAVQGIEALARWDDTLLGSVSPREFVPIAEQAHLMHPMGEQLLRLAVERAAVLSEDAGDDGFTLGVNVSLVQLRRPDFAEQVAETLQNSAFPPGRLMIDVPESTMLSEDDVVSGTLIKLAELGVRIAIDDFGTGYLALSGLQWLPVHTLKVDRQLTESPDDPRTLAVVQAVIEIAHEVDLQVVMEGVSTAGLAEYWRAAGADSGQGFGLASPAPWTGLAALVRDGVPLGGG